jgi:hypothetical protein
VDNVEALGTRRDIDRVISDHCAQAAQQHKKDEERWTKKTLRPSRPTHQKEEEMWTKKNIAPRPPNTQEG